MQSPDIHILYDNYALDARFTPDWGLALLLELPQLRLLFDSGASPEILLANMQAAAVSPDSIDAVFLSHNHWDHQGGLEALLEIKPEIEVFIHSRFAASFSDGLRRRARRLQVVEGPGEILPGIFSTGPLEAAMPEQSLLLPLEDETLICVGCAHPGLAAVLDAAAAVAAGKPFRLVGGMHLKNHSRTQIIETAEMLKARGVCRVAPCHCSGDAGREILRQLYRDGCTLSGVGGRL